MKQRPTEMFWPETLEVPNKSTASPSDSDSDESEKTDTYFRFFAGRESVIFQHKRNNMAVLTTTGRNKIVFKNFESL